MDKFSQQVYAITQVAQNASDAVEQISDELQKLKVTYSFQLNLRWV